MNIQALAIILLALVVNPAASADEDLLVPHLDRMLRDPALTLRDVVDTTFQQYPQGSLIGALDDEAKALHRRSDSLVAGYPMIYLQWIDDRAMNDRGVVQVQSGYQVPFWMWNQRSASRTVAEDAEKATASFAAAVKHEVAGLVRNSLWNLELVQNRRELAQQVYDFSRQLYGAVKRRVELGDLARSDQLLAESDLLEKQSLLTQAEAEVMHARKAYSNLTRMETAPVRFVEEQAALKDITPQHPAVAAASALIERAQAEVEFTRLSKQGNQPSVMLGTQHDKAGRGEGFNNETNLVLQIPIGGDSWNAPAVAQSNVTLTQKVVDRNILLRQLEKALHEARHNLEVDHALLQIAEQRKTLAETHSKMSKLAFESGEIQLIDYLKILATAQAAIRDAQERSINLQRDIATYNQVVGVMP
jgi:outer membrane protein TolC